MNLSVANGSTVVATAAASPGKKIQLPPSRCVLHASVFKWMAPVKQMTITEQMELLKRCDRFIHERHAAHALIRDAIQQDQQQKQQHNKQREQFLSSSSSSSSALGVTDCKRRKVYKLIDSHSTKAVSALYERYLDFLNGHSTDCTLSLDRAADDVRRRHGATAATTTVTGLLRGPATAVLRLRHRTNGVHTNYSNGSDEDMLDEESDAAAAAGAVGAAAQLACFKFRSVDVSSIEYPDASRTVNVESGLACPDTVDQHPYLDGNNDNDDDDDDDDDREDYEEVYGVKPKQHGIHSIHQHQPQLLRYIEHPIHRHAIKLLDFVFFSAYECWSLWNDVLDRCLLVHRHKRLYPIKDSVYQIIMIQQQQQQQHQNNAALFTAAATNTGDIVVPFHEHGLLTKLGLLVDFVNSFRVLVRYSIVCCCYAMNRQATHRLHYAKKHDCYFPATSQGVYQELFLTSRIGHELLCNLPCATTADCFRWLATFQQAREQVCDRKKIPYTDRLRQHLNSLENSYGGYRR